MSEKGKLTEAQRYAKDIARKIRAGILPRYHFAKADGISGHLERVSDPKRKGGMKTKLTWRMVSTYNKLAKGEE